MTDTPENTPPSKTPLPDTCQARAMFSSRYAGVRLRRHGAGVLSFLRSTSATRFLEFVPSGTDAARRVPGWARSRPTVPHSNCPGVSASGPFPGECV